jgi:fructokinase
VSATAGAGTAGLRIGIDLGGTKTSGVVLVPDGNVLAGSRIPSARDSYPATLATVAGLVASLEGQAGVEPGSLPVGIGTPGAWVPRAGVMKNCNSTWLNGRPLVADLAALLGPRVRVANDADCFALSEAADGAAAGAGLVFGVILGTGVGGGIVFGDAVLPAGRGGDGIGHPAVAASPLYSGRTHGGPNGLGGEWGHTPVPYLRQPGRVDAPADAELAALESRLARRACYCGRYDCVETFLSGPGLAAIHAELWGEHAAPETLAAREDEPARLTLELHRELLARSLAQLVNILDPDVIVLGGGLSNLPGLVGSLAARIPAWLFDAAGGAAHGLGATTRIERARWGDDSGVRGAARLWP